MSLTAISVRPQRSHYNMLFVPVDTFNAADHSESERVNLSTVALELFELCRLEPDVAPNRRPVNRYKNGITLRVEYRLMVEPDALAAVSTSRPETPRCEVARQPVPRRTRLSPRCRQLLRLRRKLIVLRRVPCATGQGKDGRRKNHESR
jgi:hypothetical protein